MMDIEVPNVALAPNVEHRGFEADEWVERVLDGSEPEPRDLMFGEPEGGDEEDDDQGEDEGRRAMRVLRTAGIPRPVEDDPGFCYMCDGPRVSTSLYAMGINAIIDEIGGKVSLQALCRTIHRHYHANVQPVVKKRWYLKSVLEHVTRHCATPGVIKSNNLRLLLDYQRTLCRFTRRIDRDTQEELPPDSSTLHMHLRVMKAMEPLLRTETASAKRQRVS
jgi:hypothetical protein